MPITCADLNPRATTPKPAVATTLPVYPQHRAGWLHTLSVILTRAEAAREIGTDAVLLILTIAIQEAAQQCHGPPRFFDAELQRMLGLRSRGRLDKARQKAIDAGWLVFIAGPDGDRSASRYWTVIPTRLNLSDDVLVDEPATPEAISSNCGNAGCLDEMHLERLTVPPSTEIPQPNLSNVMVEPQASASSILDQARSFCARSTEEPPIRSAADLGEQQIRHGSTADQSREIQAAGRTLAPETGFAAPSLSNLAVPKANVIEQTRVTRGTVSNPYIDPAVLAGGTTNGLALDLYLAYPKYSDRDAQQTDATKSIQAIHRALMKITYAQLILLVRRFAAIQNRSGQDRTKTPPLVCWFDEEQWRKIPKG